MNFFEDLVEELKEDNLLEATVVENFKTELSAQIAPENSALAENSAETVEIPDSSELSEAEHRLAFDESQNQYADFDETGEKEPVTEEDFYRRRAVDEVNCLQIVDHVVTGVEREQIKTVPKPFDDLEVKKTLHALLKLNAENDESEYLSAEAALVRESEKWCSALSHRDRLISVADLRRYCETTKPVLSSPALISLARFYRNLPFSESVRNKFDLVVTKLFSKEIGGEKRFLVFGCAELAGHLSDLYAEWSSIKFFSEDEKKSEIRQIIGQFREFVGESEKAENLDELIASGFFNRVRQFKETTDELFFEPTVTAAAVECNILIGNRYVDLIEQERNQAKSGDLQDKYGFLHDQAISDAASKTLQLVELLKEKHEAADEDQDEALQKPIAKKTVEPPAKEFELFSQTFLNFSQINRPLLIITVVITLLCGSFYVWVNYDGDEGKSTVGVQRVNLENSPYEKIIKKAQVTSHIYYAEVLPEWKNASHDNRQIILKSLLNEGKNKDYSKVVMLDEEGNILGFAEGDKLKIN